MALLEHVAFKAGNLDRTQAFYQALGVATSRPGGGERLFATFDSGTRLIFDHTPSAPDTSAVTYLGLELESFGKVDELFTRLFRQMDIRQDMREEYRHKAGPYGFSVSDPDGYVVKVFNYHE